MIKTLLTIISLSATLLLTGCGSGNNPALDSTVEGGQFISSDFAIDIPDTWEVLTEFENSYPDNSLVVLRNNVKANTFIANVNLTYEETSKNFNLSTYADHMFTTHRDTLTDFREISREALKITVNGSPATTVLNVFEGKRSSGSETLRFLQTYGFKGNMVYTVTGMYNTREDSFVREKVENTIRSFEIK